MISEEVLPEQLRGRTPQEIKFVLGQMASSVANQARRIQELEARVPAGISRATPAEPPVEPAKPKKPLEERILEDPKAVITEIVQELVGPTASQLQGSVEEIVEDVSARELDDWGDVKDEVFGLLREAGAPKTKANIEMAYDTVIGRRTRVAKRLAAVAARNPDIPREPAPQGGSFPELQGLEREIFEASGMSREDWEKYGDSSKLEIKVPTNKREAGNG